MSLLATTLEGADKAIDERNFIINSARILLGMDREEAIKLFLSFVDIPYGEVQHNQSVDS